MTEQDLMDPMFRMRRIYSCRQEGTGIAIPLKLRAEQEILVNHLITKPEIPAYVIKSRRLGISTIVDTFMADLAVFTSGIRGTIIDQKQEDATKKMVEIVRFAIDNLDSEILEGITFDKRNDSELRLRHTGEVETQDSVIYALTSGRGGDTSMLHVSEWGPIAALDPKRSREIRTGAFPSARKGRRVVETTWYGGKSGELWDLVKPILDGNPNAEGIVYFFPWHSDPEAVKITGTVTAEIEEYFIELAEKLSKTFSQEQKKWYASKKLEQGMWVKREFPSTLDESLSSPMAGTIYGDLIDAMRARKGISDFPADPSCPAFTFWDIGLSDYGCIWLVQFVGRDILLLDYCSGSGEVAAFYANWVHDAEIRHGVRVKKNYLPHDADTRERSSGKSYKDALEVAGLRNIVVVSRTPDRWLGINEIRTLMPRMFIHSTNCGTPINKSGETIPSGLDCLEFYHKKTETESGIIHEEPVHDRFSNGADALRTMGESHRNGLIDGTSYGTDGNRRRHVQVIRGEGPYTGKRKPANIRR